MDTQKPILDIKNLGIAFGKSVTVSALNGISQPVAKGRILGVVGESGSGKSITALSILRLLPQKGCRIVSGEINYYNDNGEIVDLLQLSESEIRSYRGSRFSMIFQEPMTSLNPVFKCGEQVSEVIRLHLSKNRKEAKERTLELFRKVMLPDVERIYSSYPHQLSGGQKQRVMIAMALSCDPELLIADEPTTALDVTVQAEIIRLLRSLQNELNMTIIFITHDLGVVSEIADDVAVMYKGDIVEYGPVREVFNSPKHSYTRGLIACRPPLKMRLRRLPTIAEFMKGNDPSTDKWTSNEIASRLDLISSSDVLLQVSGLSMSYSRQSGSLFSSDSKFLAIDNIEFDIRKGETLGLVGESGCGKSSLGKAIARLADVDEGKVLYKGVDLLKLSRGEMRKMRRKIQIIFQDPYASLNPRMKVGEAVLEPILIHGLQKGRGNGKRAVESLLERVGLEARHYDRYPHEFSGGQRQRIGIARALAVEPEFIICDESVSALDVSVQAQVLNLLSDLRDEFGLTYLFISHDLSVVNFISDRIMVMKAGRIEEIGSSESIFNHTKSAYTQKLIDSIPGE